MYEIVHPNLALVLLFVRSEVECGKGLLGKILHAQQELDSAVDKICHEGGQKQRNSRHLLCKYLRILWYKIARGGKKCLEVTDPTCISQSNQLCGGMEIPCRLVFSCSTKVKIDH